MSRKTSSNIVQELRNFLDDPVNGQFRADFEESFYKALKKGIRDFDDYCIKTFDDYIDWYEYLLGWVPSDREDGQFVYHVLCLFYFVMNFEPLASYTSPIDPSTKPPYTWLSQWCVRYAKEIGKFMDSPDSITPYTLATFRNSERYHMEDYPVPDGGWANFNDFFARHIDLNKRPIASAESNAVIDALCTFKGIPWPISELLDDANSVDANGNVVQYGARFAEGKFCHAFLGPNDYHRQHAPVSGTILEARVIEGLCYLQVDVVEDPSGKRTVAPRRTAVGPRMPRVDPAPVSNISAPDEPGYQFIQARALILIDTPDMGLVAVLPIGMALVSSVVLSVKAGDTVQKGDEISYFQFGGSDIVMVFEKDADVTFTADVTVHYNFGEQVAKAGKLV
ncbi:phosphatidylserine decarboxylase-domain-containing protein [Earliella scabrosa]|nr:phosphatidylserine decarboxylase-domain-containing protein [Earliella scabrosa]